MNAVVSDLCQSPLSTEVSLSPLSIYINEEFVNISYLQFIFFIKITYWCLVERSIFSCVKKLVFSGLHASYQDPGLLSRQGLQFSVQYNFRCVLETEEGVPQVPNFGSEL